MKDVSKYGDKDHGETQDTHEEISDEQILAAAREKKPSLLTKGSGQVAKYVRGRWRRQDKDMRSKEVELKVNYLRAEGHAFVQVHPERGDEIYFPPGGRYKAPPTINRLRRTVHRYKAQTTADEPVIEGVPSSSSDKARDSAEGATTVLRGEWSRMNLNHHFQRAIEIAAIMRSGFWHFTFDDHSRKVKAQKFDENGVLRFVDGSGEFVEEADDAAEIWAGDIKVDTMTPFNVRYSGSDRVETATEVMVHTLPTLRDAYEAIPDLRDVKVNDLFDKKEGDAEKWLESVKAGSVKGFSVASLDEDEYAGTTGHDLDEEDSVLDERVSVIRYYLPRGEQYEDGLEVVVVGAHTAHRGPLEYGVIPIAQFKVLDHVSDPLGVSLIDILKDPAELVDFVQSQILRYLQSMRRRWLLPHHSQVKSRDLNSPTNSVIHFNQNAGAPQQVDPPDIPSALPKFMDRFSEAYQDESGMHDTIMGKHVPGVASGRHAEALRSGDETLLGLTREQARMGLEHAGRIILEMVKEEWTEERRVRFFDGRFYIEKSFSGTDLGDTAEVELARGTLLMLTPAQKQETIYANVQIGLITPQEARRLAPLVDTAGLSLTEDPHYRRARRQNDRYLAGPPDELQTAREKYEDSMESIERQMQMIAEMSLSTEVDEVAAQGLIEELQGTIESVEAAWQMDLEPFLPVNEPWEMSPNVAMIHVEEHFRALAHEKSESLPDWWKEPFVQHAMEALQAMSPPEEAGVEGGEPPATEPAGMGPLPESGTVVGEAPVG